MYSVFFRPASKAWNGAIACKRLVIPQNTSAKTISGLSMEVPGLGRLVAEGKLRCRNLSQHLSGMAEIAKL